MDSAINDYLSHIEARHFSQSRIKHSQRTLDKLAVYLHEAHGITDWRAVGERHLRDFAVYAATRYRTAQGRKIAANTLWQWLAVACAFFRWMRETGRLLHDPAEKLKLPKCPKYLPHVLSEEAMARLIGAADTTTAVGIRDRALMETLYATAIRHAEAYKLNLYDVDTLAGRLIVRQGKGRKDRVVPLTRVAARWIERYTRVARPELAAANKLQSSAPASALWLSVYGRRLSYQMIADRIHDYSVQVDIKSNVHTFRHSCATHLLRHGASIRHIQRLLRHKGLETTEIYTHVEIADLRAVVNRDALEFIEANQ
jgi:integrase/recombinase XerD